MQDDIRSQLIKQFPSEVVESTDNTGATIYVCPTCRRAITVGQPKCGGCEQVLSWDGVRRENMKKGIVIGTVEFELPIDFTPGDCRKCPLSYIGKSAGENVYECPMNWRGGCKMKIRTQE